MKIVSSSLPKSASKSLINDFGGNFRTCIYLEAKVDRGLGNLSTSKLARNLFKRLPVPTILYGHFPFSFSLENTVTRADLVLVGLRPMSQLVFSYKRHIDKTGYSPLDLRVGGHPDVSLGWKSKSEFEQLNFLLDWLIPYSARFLLSWIWVKNNLSESLRFLFYEDIITKAYSNSLKEQFDLSFSKPALGLHFGRRSTNIVKKVKESSVDESLLCSVNEIIRMRKKNYVIDFISEEILFDYVFN
jgi:hypothetical protein